jgi:hypothetical protein
VRCVHRTSGPGVSTTRPNAGQHRAGFCRSHRVGRPGLEPGTYGLKVRKSGAPSALPALIGTPGCSERSECTERSGRCFHESFHACVDQATRRLPSVVGTSASSKPRLHRHPRPGSLIVLAGDHQPGTDPTSSPVITGHRSLPRRGCCYFPVRQISYAALPGGTARPQYQRQREHSSRAWLPPARL